MHVETTDAGTFDIGYDHLVLALGAVPRTFPVPGLAEHGLGFKDLADAISLRNRVLRELEAADAEVDPSDAAHHLGFVFVGAGYAGVEALAELSDLVNDALRWYPRLRDGAAALGARRRGAEDPPRDPAAAWRIRRQGAGAPRGRDPRRRRRWRRSTAPTAELSNGERIRDAHARVDGRGEGEPAARALRDPARRARPRPGRFVPPRRGPRARLVTRRLRRRPERAHPGSLRPADVPARAPPGAQAGEEHHRRPAALRVPHARPGGDARALQGDRRRDGPPPSAASRAGSSPAATTCSSCRSSRGSSGSWSTGRRRSSFGATSPSSPASATDTASTEAQRSEFSAAESDCLVVSTPSNRSPSLATRSSTASIVNAAGSRVSFTSSQRNGVETGAPAFGRTE